MSIETAIARITNITNLTEMKRAKAEIENDPAESTYAAMRTAFNQAIVILIEERD